MHSRASKPTRNSPASGREGRRRAASGGDGPPNPRPLELELESVEYLAASEALGLLRVAGSWRSARKRPLGKVELRVDRGGGHSSVAPLPDAATSTLFATPAGAEWRAAFPVPTEAVKDSSTRFSVAAAGAVFELPHPAAREGSPEPGADERPAAP